MAFNSSNFLFHTRYPSDGGTVNTSPVVWKYTTTDNLSDLDSNLHYFDGEINVRPYDWIAVMAADKNAWYRISTSNPDPSDPTVLIAKFTEVSAFSGQVNIP